MKKLKLAKIDETNSNDGMNDSYLSQSNQKMLSEDPDSDSMFTVNSPYKNLIRKSSIKKRFKNSIHFRSSISLNANTIKGLREKSGILS